MDFDGPAIDCGDPTVSRAALTYCSPGQFATSQLLQRTKGFGLQITDSQDLFGWSNQAIVGADYTDSQDTFAQEYQFGPLAPDRLLIYQPSPFNDETVISLSGTNKIYGAYFTDTLSPNKLLHVTLSVRYNRNTETLNGQSIDTDIGDFGNGFDEPTSLTGNHTYSRVKSRARIYRDAHRLVDLLCQL